MSLRTFMLAEVFLTVPLETVTVLKVLAWEALATAMGRTATAMEEATTEAILEDVGQARHEQNKNGNETDAGAFRSQEASSEAPNVGG